MSEHIFAGSRFLGKKFISPKIIESSFVVASVEAGNTTTKCIITATDMKTGKTEIVGKCVRLTKDVRKPAEDEEIFGKTISGTPLTRKSLADLVKETVTQALFENNLKIEEIHFVVRSAGITADTGAQLEMIILALADGCLNAGFSPRKMTGYLHLNRIPENLKPYSYLDKIHFDGAVAGVRPPAGLGKSIISNEMEGELAMAGLKEAAKHGEIELKNPGIAIDMGTTLSGRISDSGEPYAKTVGNFCGYAGAIADALIQKINPGKSIFELTESEKRNLTPSCSENSKQTKEIEAARLKIMKQINIMKIQSGRTCFGPFAVNQEAANECGVTLFGCDVGENGSGMEVLAEIGKQLYDSGGMDAVIGAADEVMSDMTVSLIKCIQEAGYLNDETVIGITGRAGITGKKQELTLQKLKREKIIENPEKQIIFAEDGLARGAAVMARCMNSLGCPNNPLGGRHGEKCIMAKRIKFQRGL
jgi:putative methanogenesis marker protein 14